ncbi:MAG: hypothetical protein V4457_12295 [Pseudomonadota bacterium]
MREFKPARNAGEISDQTAIALRIAKEVIHEGLTDGYSAVTGKSGIAPDFFSVTQADSALTPCVDSTPFPEPGPKNHIVTATLIKPQPADKIG